LAKGDYDKAYAELLALSKRSNVIRQEEHPELLRCNPEQAASFGFAETPSRNKRRDSR
jgi:hypothetical protein